LGFFTRSFGNRVESAKSPSASEPSCSVVTLQIRADAGWPADDDDMNAVSQRMGFRSPGWPRNVTSTSRPTCVLFIHTAPGSETARRFAADSIVGTARSDDENVAADESTGITDVSRTRSTEHACDTPEASVGSL
jgi:hypothetical protein